MYINFIWLIEVLIDIKLVLLLKVVSREKRQLTRYNKV